MASAALPVLVLVPLAAGSSTGSATASPSAAREISLVRSAGRAETRVAQAFVEFARERLA